MWHGLPYEKSQPMALLAIFRSANLVRVNSAVSSVGSTMCLGSLLNVDVSDDEVFGIEFISRCVGFSVLDQVGQEFGRLDGPSTCTGALRFMPKKPSVDGIYLESP